MNFLRRWFSRTPASGDALRRAHECFDAGQFEAAASAYAALVAADPSPGLHVNLAYSLWMSGQPGAEAQFRRAVGLDGEFAPAWTGLGDLAAAQGEHAAAVGHYARAIRSDAKLAVAHNNLSQSLMALGRLEEAWRESEWRFAAPGAQSLYPHSLALPRWDGKKLDGRLLVHWEQGFGDMLQHLRFLPPLESRGIDFVFECPPPLERLVSRSLAGERVHVATDAAPDSRRFAATCGLLSLPHLLGVTVATLPKPPYLQAERFEVGRLARLANLTEGAASMVGPRVGLVWRGSDFDRSRNASLEDFSGLAGAGGQLVALQKGMTVDESSRLAVMGGVDTGALLEDFAATADLIEALDRVVTVDTAVAHLAGALGKPVELLLNDSPAVRWGTSVNTTPWYPSMRLWRRRPGEAWPVVVERVASTCRTDSAV
jgi:hypothetical protein